METVKWQFGSLSPQAEEDYIAAKCRDITHCDGDPVGGAGGPAHATVDADDAFDEWAPATAGTRCDVCTIPHWEGVGKQASAAAQWGVTRISQPNTGGVRLHTHCCLRVR